MSNPVFTGSMRAMSHPKATTVLVGVPLMLAALIGCTSTTTTSPQTSSPTNASPGCAPQTDCATDAAGLPTGFVRLADVAPTILQEMRYPTDHNFVGSPLTGTRHRTVG